MKMDAWEHVSGIDQPALAATDFVTTIIHVGHTSVEVQPSWDQLITGPALRAPKPGYILPFSVVSFAYLLGIAQTIVITWWVS